jgi:tetratricopeptide (TPR) repeat protein
MSRDSRGEPVSTTSAGALDRFETAVTLMAGYFTDPLAAIDEALAEDPGFIMGHCFRAGLLLIAAQKSVEPELRRSVEAAEALAHRANNRERGHMAAARAWLDGDFHRTADLYGKVVEDHPRDLAALQFAHQCDFFVGNTRALRERPAGVLPHWNAGDPGYGFVLGMHGFGLEENNDFRRAEEAGRAAVELIPRNPWAIHGVAHVLLMERRLDEGIAWMTARTADWAPDNMLAIHNWWHLALCHLDLGRIEDVLSIYDRNMRPRPEALGLELADATAMLWRLHLRGIDVGDRWREVADGWEPMAADGYYAFNDMHAMMAFTADGRGEAAETLAAALARRVNESGCNAVMTREVGLPVCAAVRAFGAGDYGTAADLLLPLPAKAHVFGGSNAQRDIIALTLAEAMRRSGRVSGWRRPST